MQRSGSQKVLLVLSIIEIIFAVLGLFTSIMMFTGGGILGAVTSSEAAAASVDPELVAAGSSLFIALGVFLLISSLFSLFAGIFGIRAANDASRIMPVWIFCLITMILSIIGIIVSLVNGTFGANALTLILELVFSIIMFKIAGNIKHQL